MLAVDTSATMLWTTVNLVIYFFVTWSYATDYENEYGPDYGTKWLLFLDENGTTHEVNLTTLPPETRGIQLGGVYFYLYTRENINNGELLTIPYDDTRIESKYFNSANEIKAITHGWLSKANTEWLQNMKNALLDRKDFNVIAVDWSELAQNPLYPWPAVSTRYVGKRLSKLLDSLTKSYEMKNPDTHLIGHSLGAHVMGYAGMYSEQKIKRISGLDPARPLFELPLMNKNFRLDDTDADFVDIIHTSSGVLGYEDSHGHADFYPNGGKPKQPGCEGRQHAIEGCSHGRSITFFIESIDPTARFKAYPCDSWENYENGKCRSNATLMGYPANSNQLGDFYLRTNNQSRYAIDDE
ncbi:hypothetical protein ACJJTC_009217 [Scirpophaga incertulas]